MTLCFKPVLPTGMYGGLHSPRMLLGGVFPLRIGFLSLALNTLSTECAPNVANQSTQNTPSAQTCIWLSHLGIDRLLSFSVVYFLTVLGSSSFERFGDPLSSRRNHCALKSFSHPIPMLFDNLMSTPLGGQRPSQRSNATTIALPNCYR